MHTAEAAVLLRNDCSVQLRLPDAVPLDCAAQALASLQTAEGEFFVEGEQLWHVVKYMRTMNRPGVLLKEGDVIKLGRVSMRVKTLRATDEEDTQDSSEDDAELEWPGESGTCRVCLSDEASAENPMISPCVCTGSVKHIHLECLQTWIESRKTTKESENAVNQFWKTMDCELCKAPYPLKVLKQGRAYHLYRIQQPQAPYIVFEPLVGERSAGMHIVSFRNKCALKVGRGHDTDIRVSDISVSRFHASLHFQDGHFLLEDNRSKFGCLVLARGPVQVRADTPTFLQMGRTVASFSVVKR